MTFQKLGTPLSDDDRDTPTFSNSFSSTMRRYPRQLYSSTAGNTQARAISSGTIRRPETLLRHDSLSVSMAAGVMQFTCTLWGEADAAAFGYDIVGHVRDPNVKCDRRNIHDLQDFCATIRGRTSRAHWNAPFRCTACISSHCCSVISRKLWRG
jgi:hypothetical protein